MPTLVILATSDSALADAWERQLPPGRIALRLTEQAFPGGTAPGFSAVVVLDAVAEATLPPSLARCPTIFVGEPRSLPFEQARMAGRAKVYLSYEESATRLRELLPLVEDVAEKQSLVEMLRDKGRRPAASRPVDEPASADVAELWDFLEGAVENLESRERIITEFRRAARQLLRAAHAVFFVRDGANFRADRGESFFPVTDPLVAFFEQHPTLIDGTVWDDSSDLVEELAVRNRLALWGARLLVPVHDNGRLLGLIALGVRDDGQPYSSADRARVVQLARLLRHFLTKSADIARLTRVAAQTTLGAKYLPGTLVLGPEENAPRHVPLVVRDLVGQVRRTKDIARIAPSLGQPFRASAGLIAETGGVWATWQEASADVHETASRERGSRRELLRELSLTLSHELGNALVSLATFRQSNGDRPMPAPFIETMKNDVAALEALNGNLEIMQSFHESEPATVDIREVAQTAGHALGVRVEPGTEPVVLEASRKLLDFALRAILRTIAENRRDGNAKELTLRVRSTGSGPDATALLSIKGEHLELEGVLPEPVDGGVPNQGRLGVFLAKEILRLHGGEIHAGPGMEGTEILISVRRW
ncbi:MAG: GAF domain-containing sensor histidine kinase [Opitutaceae bacterium]|nr:GAF domain-containing sensor histidine kinase [Opitutaceae bacterium]